MHNQISKSHYINYLLLMYIITGLICVFPSSSDFPKVLSKEKEIQKTRDIKEDISSRIHDVSEKMKAISTSLNDKASDVHHAKDETKVSAS